MNQGDQMASLSFIKKEPTASMWPDSLEENVPPSSDNKSNPLA